MSEITKALAVTAELTGTELSAVALRAMEADLSQYPQPAVMSALNRCRRELTGRLTLAAILERLNAIDGRPTANEAWAIALRGFDETQTIVSNQEITEGMRSARPILDAGDEVGARMAFRDAYERIVAVNRDAGIKPEWFPSLGTDSRLRDSVLEDAERKGLLTQQHVAALLPAKITGDGKGVVALLENRNEPSGLSPKARAKIHAMKKMLGRKVAA